MQSKEHSIKIFLDKKYIEKCISYLSEFDFLHNTKQDTIRLFIRIMKKAFDRKTNKLKDSFRLTVPHSLAGQMIVVICKIERIFDIDPNHKYIKKIKLKKNFFGELFRQLSRAWAGKAPNISDYERSLIGKSNQDAATISRKKKKIREYDALIKANSNK